MRNIRTISSCIFTSLLLFFNSNASEACSFTASFSGDTMVCAGISSNYLTKPITGHYYRWVVKGGIIVSGQGKDSLWVNWSTPGIGTVKLIDSTSSCKDSLTRPIQIELTSASLTAAQYNMEGGTSVSGSLYTLTQYGTANEYSAAWNQYMINLNKNFDFTFMTNQGNSAMHAEGMVFVLQNTGNKASPSTTSGDDMGYYEARKGDMDESVGIEEDIFNSSGFADSSSSHLNLVINKNFQPIRPQVNISPALSNGSNRKLRVTWNRDANLLEVYFDGAKEFSWNNDIVKNVFNGNPNVWFGFTGATGTISHLGTHFYNFTDSQSIKTDTLIYNQAIISSTNDTICAGDTAVLTSSGGPLYNWSTGATTKSIKVFTSGTYTVSVTDSFNCTSSSSHTIVVTPKVIASFTISNSCTGNYVSLTNNTSPNTGVRYMWYFGKGDSLSGKIPAYFYKSSGTYNITVSATNGECTSTATNPVIVYDHPWGITVSKGTPFQGQFNNGDIVTPDYACLSDTNAYQFSSPIGYSNSDYGTKWVISSKILATISGTLCKDTMFKNPTSSHNAYFKVFPGTNFTDSVLVLTVFVQLIPGNCDTEIIRYIKFRPNAISKFVFNNACQGFPFTFIDSSTIAKGDTVSHWNWNFGDSLSSTSRNPNHVYASPGDYNVTLSATSKVGCGIPVSQTVTQFPAPIPAFHAVVGCQDASSVFTDSSKISNSSIISHAWSFGDGGHSSQKSPKYTYSKSGPYLVKLVETSISGCKDSVTKSIRIEPVPVSSFSYKNACLGTPINFANNSIDSTLGTKYLWNFGDGKTSASTLSSHSYTANGTYNVKLIVNSIYGCTDTSVQKVTPYVATKANFAFSGTCIKNTTTFGDSDKNNIGVTYSWDFGDGKTDVASTDKDSHAYKNSGTYKVSLATQTSDGCVDSGSENIIIYSYPIAAFYTSSVCEGNPLILDNLSTGTGLTYSWNFGDPASGKNNSSAFPSPVHTYDSAGSYSVTLTATNAGGCANIITQKTNVAAAPIVGPWSFKINNQTVNFAPQDTTQKTYEWYFGNGDISSVKKPVYSYHTKGKYDVKLVETNTNGCSGSYSDSITISTLGVAPVSAPANNLNISIFPNPFENKTMISYTLDKDSKVSVSVYDIQGKLVAELKNGDFGAGKYQDEFDAVKYSASEGVYLLKMKVNGEEFTGRIVEMK